MKQTRHMIDEFVKQNYQTMTDAEIAKHLDLNEEQVRRVRRKYNLRKVINKQNAHLVDEPMPPPQKTGLEVRGDHIVINWTTKTIITELGEFGQMVCSFDMHKAVQRAYVHMGEGETAAMVAMKFDFPHAKAVILYAKIHGFTKSSLPQTDIEFESGMTVDEAVAENIQSMKRKTYKETEKAKWAEIMKGYERWTQFHHTVLKPFENWIEEYLPKRKVTKLQLTKAPNEEVACVVGLSDLHFMKDCYDAFGSQTYNREIALQKMNDAVSTLIAKKLQTGVPEKFYLTIGGDDLHVDNQNQSTTKGTPQQNSTDGPFRTALGPYLDMNLALIDTFAQVADVEVVVTPGNHNENTALLLGVAIERYYRLWNKQHNANTVTVVNRFHERIYLQYGTNCFIFNHMSKMSLSKTKKELHKLILAEAKAQGINLQEIKNFTMFGQHLHHDLQEDLGGMVELVVFMSLSEEDDWHQDSGYVGSKKRLALYNYSKTTGKDSVLYS